MPKQSLKFMRNCIYTSVFSLYSRLYFHILLKVFLDIPSISQEHWAIHILCLSQIALWGSLMGTGYKNILFKRLGRRVKRWIPSWYYGFLWNFIAMINQCKVQANLGFSQRLLNCQTFRALCSLLLNTSSYRLALLTYSVQQFNNILSHCFTFPGLRMIIHDTSYNLR